jgi:hypothetical protein
MSLTRLRTLALATILLLPLLAQASQLTALRQVVAEHRELLTLMRAKAARGDALVPVEHVVAALARTAEAQAQLDRSLAQVEGWCRAQRLTYHGYDGRVYITQLTPECQEDTP